MIMRPELNDAEKQLVAALRSGKYVQGQHCLRKGDTYCCLGVACDIFKQEEWIRLSQAVFQIEENKMVLPDRIVNILNWKHWQGSMVFYGFNGVIIRHFLSELNDAGLTFGQIADIIEAGMMEHQQDAI